MKTAKGADLVGKDPREELPDTGVCNSTVIAGEDDSEIARNCCCCAADLGNARDY